MSEETKLINNNVGFMCCNKLYTAKDVLALENREANLLSRETDFCKQIKELKAENEKLKELSLELADDVLEYESTCKELEQFGWVWCKDELPKHSGSYVSISEEHGSIEILEFANGEWQPEEASQWLRAPDPMEGEG